MRQIFQNQLQQLKGLLIQMGHEVTASIDETVEALVKGDSGIVPKIMEQEEAIDQMEREIESLCMQLFLRQQPVAKDFRLVTAALKMVTDMERIGDHALDISEITELAAKGHSGDYDLGTIREMAGAATGMLHTAIDAYVRQDTELARNVLRQDDTVDQFYVQVKQDTITRIRENRDAELTLDYLLAAKYLERVGDHACNIAEWVVFALTGERM